MILQFCQETKMISISTSYPLHTKQNKIKQDKTKHWKMTFPVLLKEMIFFLENMVVFDKRQKIDF